jgi:chromosome segregation ATPase
MLEVRQDAPAPGPPSGDEASRAPIGLRIDGPHTLGAPLREVASDDLPPPDSAEESAWLLAQMRTQTEQLGALLRQQQQELDCREARLNAQCAQLDQQGRDLRLWFQERQAELEEERAAIAGSLAAQGERHIQLEADAEILRHRQEEQAARETFLLEIIRQLKIRRDAVRSGEIDLAVKCQAAEAELAASREAAETELRQARAEIDALREECQSRAAALCERESEATRIHDELIGERSRLAAEREELESRRDSLLGARERLEDEVAVHRRAVQEDRRRADEELQGQLALLDDRKARLDEREVELERFRAELRQAQRETLEMRLATEELWARLSAGVPAAALSRSLAEIRGRLADHFRLAAREVQERLEELRAARRELAAEHNRLASERHAIQEWVDRRQAELDDLAAVLALRERELADREARLDRLEDRDPSPQPSAIAAAAV